MQGIKIGIHYFSFRQTMEFESDSFYNMNARTLTLWQELWPIPRLRAINVRSLLKNDLAGDVKRLTHFTPEYRLRAGSYRVLFEVEGAKG